MPSDLSSLNQRFYQSRTVAEWYATKDFTFPEEQAFLDRHGDEAVSGKSILDIGIGAGRTTRFLLPVAARYVGVDYSPDMVDAARERFPEATLQECDARDLSAYADGEFDMVLFSFNGMDCLSHEGRMAAMSEIRRVLRPGGWFAFSSHNRSRQSARPWGLDNFSFSKHPLRLWANTARYMRGMMNWLRSRELAVENEEYAMRHDSSNIFAAPTYYIDKKQQVAQLARAGFETLSIFTSSKGAATTAAEPDATSAWNFFVTRKTDSPPVGGS